MLPVARASTAPGDPMSGLERGVSSAVASASLPSCCWLADASPAASLRPAEAAWGCCAQHASVLGEGCDGAACMREQNDLNDPGSCRRVQQDAGARYASACERCAMISRMLCSRIHGPSLQQCMLRHRGRHRQLCDCLDASIAKPHTFAETHPEPASCQQRSCCGAHAGVCCCRQTSLHLASPHRLT